MNGLIGRCCQHQEFVPFVRQQSRVHLDGQFRVKRKTFGPLYQFVDYRVAYLAEFVRQFGFGVQQFVQLETEIQKMFLLNQLKYLKN
jgi:hypothetical protein